jgi:hypothetical protein
MEIQNQSLWASAKAKLDKNDQDLLAFEDQDKLDILDKLRQTTREAYDTCVRKRWQVKLPGKHGEQIIIRDLLSKIAHWLQVFKEVGDQLVQYDPGHTALPWAGTRFLLQVSFAKNEASWLALSPNRLHRLLSMTSTSLISSCKVRRE